MKLQIGKLFKKKKENGHILAAKCRFCGKIIVEDLDYDLSQVKSWQIVTCEACRDRLPKHDYYGEYFES